MVGYRHLPAGIMAAAPPTLVPSKTVRPVPLTTITRGGVVESTHMGSIAVVNREGQLLYAAGDPHALTFTRSALKPLQAMPFVAGGGVERFGYSLPQVALLCASHSGEPRHVEAVADMLHRAGNAPEDLQCGTHPPTYFELRGEIPPQPALVAARAQLLRQAQRHACLLRAVR